MLQVSDAYKELVKSNIRPKCEPKIKATGTDAQGNTIVFQWNASNIKDLKYSRGIDPVGRELPFMELTWTEIYYGKLDEQSTPEKYNNVTEYMRVDLSFEQEMGQAGQKKYTWADYSETYWGEVSGQTWGQIGATTVSRETISFRPLFLTSKPIIKNNVITWTARDLLYFCNTPYSAGFNFEESELEYGTLMAMILLRERGQFLNSPIILNNIIDSSELFSSLTFDYFSSKIIINSDTKNILMNLLACTSHYLDFRDFLVSGYAGYEGVPTHIPNDVVYKFPEIEKGTTISIYQFTQNRVEANKENETTSANGSYIKGKHFWRYPFDEYGYLSDATINAREMIVADGKYALSTHGFTEPLEYTKYIVSKIEHSIPLNLSGEIFMEDNPLCALGITDESGDADDVIETRINVLKKYFGKNNNNVTVECLPNLAIETGDFISVDTNLYSNDAPIRKKGIVTQINLTYNGALKETFKFHEMGE